MSTPRVNIAGLVFGRLTAQRYLGGGRWACVCSCGNETVVVLGDLRKSTKSCGCLRRELARIRGIASARHGLSNSPEYHAWERMLSRCLNPRDAAYANYGSRGISVCRRWRKFDEFIKDMGRRPSPAHTLERKDNDGSYMPSNCEWATRKKQARNRRTNRMLTHKGVTQCLAMWSESLGVNRQVIYDRLKCGWSVKKTLTTPVAKRSKRGV